MTMEQQGFTKEQAAYRRHLAQKAKRIAHYIRTLVRVNGIRWNGTRVSQTQGLRPTTRATSLSPLGGPMMSGLARRPVWLDPRTPKIIRGHMGAACPGAQVAVKNQGGIQSRKKPSGEGTKATQTKAHNC